MKKSYNLQLFKKNELVLTNKPKIYIDGAGYLHIIEENFKKILPHDTVIRYKINVNGNEFTSVQDKIFIGRYIHEGSDNSVSVKIIVDMRDYVGSYFYKEV